jgi:hypothetical protein
MLARRIVALNPGGIMSYDKLKKLVNSLDGGVQVARTAGGNRHLSIQLPGEFPIVSEGASLDDAAAGGLELVEEITGKKAK